MSLHIGPEVEVAALERGPADPDPLHFHLQHGQRCPPYLGGGPSDNSPVKSILVRTASFYILVILVDIPITYR